MEATLSGSRRIYEKERDKKAPAFERDSPEA
jgi:hypothetical protein